MHPSGAKHVHLHAHNSHRRPSDAFHKKVISKDADVPEGILEESEDELDEDKRVYRSKRDGGASTPDKDGLGGEAGSDPMKPIFNEEIARLRIKEAELANLAQQEQCLEQHQQQQQQQQKTVPVRKEIPEDQRKPRMRRVGLLKRQPPAAASTVPAAATVTMVTAPAALATAGESGPRFDQQGRLILHSILGSPAEYYRLAVAKGKIRPEDVPPEAREELPTQQQQPPPPPSQPPPPPRPFPAPAADMAALNNWQLKMVERKRLQGRISKLLDRPIGDLVMNSADNQRTEIEDKDLISRAIPFFDYGKGYRCASEFWHQPVPIGDAKSGIHATLTRTQRGDPPPWERVGLSSVARAERGLPTSGDDRTTESAFTSPATSPRYPWKRQPLTLPSSYKESRASQLAGAMLELEAHRPDLRRLVVVGRGGGGVSEVGEVETDQPVVGHDDGRRSASAVNCEKTPGHPQQTHRLTGPSMMFGGQPARWLGDPSKYRGTPGIEARVFLDATVGKPSSQCLEFENDGTTVLFYRWRRLEQPNPFGLVKPPVRRFYFDTSGGVLLPGERLHFPFIFKSNQPGLFTERWRLETTPSLLGGADLIVALRGLAVATDVNFEARAELENKLTRRKTVRLVSDILDELVVGLPLNERQKSGQSDDSIDEIEAFMRANSSILSVCRLGQRWWQPDAALLTRLRRLHAGASSVGNPDDKWDLSLATLRNRLLQLPESSKTFSASSAALSSSSSAASRSAAGQGVGRLYALVNERMSFCIDMACCSRRQRRYVLCYRIVMETTDKVFNFWHYQRSMSGLPEFEADFPDPGSRRSRLAGGRRQRLQTPSSAASTRMSTSGSARSSQRPTSVAKEDRKPVKWQQQQQKRPLQQRQQQQQQEENDNQLISYDRETAEQMCSDKIYAATYCLLADMVEQIADVCEGTTETGP